MMQHGVSLILGRKDRHIGQGYVRMGAQASRHRVTFSIEEALRLVNLPQEDEGRIYHFRRLSLPSIPVEASREVWVERMQEVLTIQAQRAVHGADPRSHTSDAVYFDHEDEALEVLLRSALLPDVKPAWFWKAVIGIDAGSHSSLVLPVVLECIRNRRSPQVGAAIIMTALNGLNDPNPAPLLSSISASTMRDWIRSLESSGTMVFGSRPVALPEKITTILRSAARQFGWNDHRTLWLAVKATLSVASSSQSTRISVKRAHATLQYLKSTDVQLLSATCIGAERLHTTNDHHIRFEDQRDAVEFGSVNTFTSLLSTTVTNESSLQERSSRKSLFLRGEESCFAGLYFQLHVLRRLYIEQALRVCPALVEADFVAQVIRKLAIDAGVPESDPILVAINTTRESAPSFTLSSEALAFASEICPPGLQAPFSRLSDSRYLVRLWAIAVRRWCWRMGAITVKEITVRRGRVWLTRNHLDIALALADADIRIRRLGLDIDPGWLPWLGAFGLVVQFHYREHGPGGDWC
jgi:hypothetical protein